MKCRNERCLLNKDKTCLNVVVISGRGSCMNKDIPFKKTPRMRHWIEFPKEKNIERSNNI